MKQTFGPAKAPADAVAKDIRHATCTHYSAEDKIRIMLEGVRGEDCIAELCRCEGITLFMYYGWSKEFLGGWQKATGRRHGPGCQLRQGFLEPSS